MATITEIKRKNGSVAHSIRFTRDGKRHVLTMESAFTRADVEEVAAAIDDVLTSERMGESVKRRTRVFFENAPQVILEKLENVGILDAKPHLPFGEVLLRFMDRSQQTLKPNTLLTYRTSIRRIVRSVNVNSPIESIKESEVAEVAKALRMDYSPLSVETIVSKMKAIWNWAIQEGYCDSNVWNGVKLHGQKLPGRDFEIPDAWTPHILDACPSQQWRALYVLWRYGGLRKNEPLSLRWSDVNWERRRLCVRSSKTERYEGRESRIIPLFPEIERELSDLFAIDSGEAPTIINMKSALSATLKRIVTRAGYKPWPRLFQNLRATRENELVERGFPAHVVGEWLGHSPAVQAKHYLRVLDSYYDSAIGLGASGEAKTKPISVENN